MTSASYRLFTERYAVVMLLLLPLGLLLLRFGASIEFAVRAALCGVFIVIAVLDWRTRRIPNVLLFSLGAIALLINILHPETLGITLLGGVFGLAPFALAAWLRPAELGGGDVKLAAVIGLCVGFPNVVWVLLVGALSGGAVALALLLSKRGTMKTEIAYGPYLCLGVLCALVILPLPVLPGT